MITINAKFIAHVTLTLNGEVIHTEDHIVDGVYMIKDGDNLEMQLKVDIKDSDDLVLTGGADRG